MSSNNPLLPPLCTSQIASGFVGAQPSGTGRLAKAIAALNANPKDPRAQREVYNAIRVATMSELSGKLSYQDVEEVAQRAAASTLKAALLGKTLLPAYARTAIRGAYAGRVQEAKAAKRDSSAFEFVPVDSVDLASAEDPWEPLETAEHYSPVLQKLAELPWKLHDVLALRFLEGQTLQEVADRLGLSVPTVHRLEKQGLRQMRELLAA